WRRCDCRASGRTVAGAESARELTIIGSMTHYHIIGIAGAGMSAIANVLLDQGHSVSGSDLQRNALADALAARGATIFQGHDPAYVAGADMLVVTSATRPEHPEVAAAQVRGIPIL